MTGQAMPPFNNNKMTDPFVLETPMRSMFLKEFAAAAAACARHSSQR